MSSILTLDQSLITNIISFLVFSQPYSRAVKEAYRNTYHFLTVHALYYRLFKHLLILFAKKYNLMLEYSGCEYCFTGLACRNADPPYLVDALSSNSRTTFSTYENFTEKTERDVKDMIDLIPNALITKGRLPYQFRYQISPLSAACFNPQVPLSLIEYMLQKDADPNEPFIHTAVNLSISTVYDLELSLKFEGADRNDLIYQRNVSLLILLEKYGGESICTNTGYEIMFGDKPLIVTEDDFPDLTPFP